MRTASFPTLSFITIHCSSGSEGCPEAIKHHTSNVALCIRCGPRQEVFGQHLRPTMKQRDFFFLMLCVKLATASRVTEERQEPACVWARK